MRGRKPKPTKLKLISGTYRSDRASKNEPKPQLIRPTCPKFLSLEAKREWRRIALELEQLGLLTRLDRAVLAGYCQYWATWMEMTKLLKEKGPLYKTQKGNIIISPISAVANRAYELMVKSAAELGITISSRSRLTVPEREDGFDEFLRSKH